MNYPQLRGFFERVFNMATASLNLQDMLLPFIGNTRFMGEPIYTEGVFVILVPIISLIK